MKKGNTIISIIAFFSVFFVFCGFAIDFSLLVAKRAILQTTTESAALAAVNQISETPIKAEKTAQNILNFSKITGLNNLKIEKIEIKENSKAVNIKVSANAQTYFLAALGINYIEIQAQSSAIISPIDLTPQNNFELQNHIQFVSPSLIFSKNGPELNIIRSDNTSEYLVFVGLNNKNNETKWVEITCSSNDHTAKEQAFDFDAECIKEQNEGGISAAKYIRLVNNNLTSPLEIETLQLTNASRLIRSKSFNEL